MKNLQLITLLILVLMGADLKAQNALAYEPNLSEKKKGTKPKQLEGMEGDVQKVLLVSQKDDQVDLKIELEGYEGKYLKVFALSKSGSRMLEIPADIQKIRSGNIRVSADLKLSGTRESVTDYIELVFTNGMFRFKGMSYVYKLKKQWTPKTADGDNSDIASNSNRSPQIIEVQLRPVGNARRTFIAQ
ncbi:hypothetical protein [Muriicola sp. Z0-33]|uniref:hypothetical protein n=1 Tax=Muriicola sp. Z0-33 TaxID=2816957 RepID=UPI002237226D|nr:hypothetical protein [Muriicola sp. Z0-33]MCW5516889.1 hypothetical protein [Muriicola sp. Z0-33]